MVVVAGFVVVVVGFVVVVGGIVVVVVVVVVDVVVCAITACPTTIEIDVPLSTSLPWRTLCSSTVPSRRVARSELFVGGTVDAQPGLVEQVARLTLGEADERWHPHLARAGTDDQLDGAAAVDERVGWRVGAMTMPDRDHVVDLLDDRDDEPVLGRFEQRSGDVDRVVDDGRRGSTPDRGRPTRRR